MYSILAIIFVFIVVIMSLFWAAGKASDKYDELKEEEELND